jgi:hypothetical protein
MTSTAFKSKFVFRQSSAFYKVFERALFENLLGSERWKKPKLSADFSPQNVNNCYQIRLVQRKARQDK